MFQLAHVVGVHVEDVDVEAESLLLSRDAGQVALGAVSHPVDAKVVTVAVIRAVLVG